MLEVENVLAVMNVADLEQVAPWYERLFGRPPDRRPMETVVEWQLGVTGGLQVVLDAERAGKSSLTLGVGDIDDALRDIAARGLHGTAETVGEQNGVPLRIAILQDPAGNMVVLALAAASRPA